MSICRKRYISTKWLKKKLNKNARIRFSMLMPSCVFKVCFSSSTALLRISQTVHPIKSVPVSQTVFGRGQQQAKAHLTINTRAIIISHNMPTHSVLLQVCLEPNTPFLRVLPFDGAEHGGVDDAR